MEKMLKLKCNFCNKEINCPWEDKDARFHSCYPCFEQRQENMSEGDLDETQVDVPPEKMNELFSEELLEEEFPALWDELKEELKEKSKKELAQEMFWRGALAMGQKLIERGEEEMREEEE
jgi:hypothetical protein